MALGIRRPRALRLRKRLGAAYGPSQIPTHQGFTTNLSPGGFGLSSVHVHPVGTQLFVRLALPGESVSVHGVVAWARRGAPQMGVSGAMGLRLLSADEGFYRFIHQHLPPAQGGSLS